MPLRAGAPSGRKYAINRNPIDPTTWALNENVKNIYFEMDDDNNIKAIPVVLIQTAASPITAGKQTQIIIADGGGATGLASVTQFGVDGLNFGGATQMLETVNLPANFNGSTWDRGTYPTGIANASAVGAASTQLVAAGGTSKKYRLWGISLSAVSTAAATDGVVTVNETTSAAVLLSLRVSATSAAVSNVSMNYQGVPQTTANNAIQVTSIANVTTDATLLYTAAY